jgi:hypothetical protein
LSKKEIRETLIHASQQFISNIEDKLSKEKNELFILGPTALKINPIEIKKSSITATFKISEFLISEMNKDPNQRVITEFSLNK